MTLGGIALFACFCVVGFCLGMRLWRRIWDEEAAFADRVGDVRAATIARRIRDRRW